MAKTEVFKVPNTAPGRKFIRELKAYLNRTTYKVRVRGRHSDRRELYRKLGITWREEGFNEVKLKHAETFGVYLDFKITSGWQIINDELQEDYRQAQMNANISERELNELEVERKKLEKELNKFKALANKYAGTGVRGKTAKSTRRIRL